MMEQNVKYALHDSEVTPPTWAARVRLTPELLQKLRERPEQIGLKLNVTAGDGACLPHNSNKKTSVLTVDMGLNGDAVKTAEQYELLSFAEDPSINHVCTFKQVDIVAGGGYSIFKAGAIHQKLLVQRLLDETEKDRIKDKHAKSVLESKSRASRLISIEVKIPVKRQRMTRLSKRLIRATPAARHTESICDRTNIILPSAMTKKQADEAMNEIGKGIEFFGCKAPKCFEKNPEFEGLNNEREKLLPLAVGEGTSAITSDAKSQALFSSDSDGNGTSHVLRSAKKKVTALATKVNSSYPARINMLRESALVADGDGMSDNTLNFDPTAQPNEASCESTKNVIIAMSAVDESHSTRANPIKKKREIEALQAIKSGVEAKRARVRSALVSDRVKQVHLPDMSCFPSSVVQICERLVSYHGRSIILDEIDYANIVETGEQFRQYWQLLDKVFMGMPDHGSVISVTLVSAYNVKAYSIEMIKMEGLHLQLESASSVSNLQETRNTCNIKEVCRPKHLLFYESCTKLTLIKQGLLVVRDAMVSIQNILHSIQSSIRRFDMKPHP